MDYLANTMTLDQFAQTIKQKHPAYADMDNQVLVGMILAKYPQYRASITGPIPETPIDQLPVADQRDRVSLEKSRLELEEARAKALEDKKIKENVYGGLTKEEFEILQEADSIAAKTDFYETRAKEGKLTSEDIYNAINEGVYLDEKYTKNIAEPMDAEMQAGKRTLDGLFNLYMGEDGTDTLAYGKEGFGGRLPGIGKKIESIISPSKDTERLVRYTRMLESSRAQLAKMAGDSGNLALQEQIMQGKALPGEGSLDGEAIGQWIDVYTKYGLTPPPLLIKKQKEMASEGKTPSDKGTTPPELPDIDVSANAATPPPQRPLPPIGKGMLPGMIDIPALDPQRASMGREEKPKRPTIGEAVRTLVGTPEAREKFLEDYAAVLRGEQDAITGQPIESPVRKIPGIKPVLSTTSGLGKNVGEGPMQAIGGLSTGSGKDVAIGTGKTALQIYGAANPQKWLTLGLPLLGAGVNAMGGEDPFVGAGEGLGEGFTASGVSKISEPIFNKVFNPRATAAANKAKAGAEATRAGKAFQSTDDMKAAAQYILNKKGYMTPEQTKALTRIASGKTISPNEVVELQPIFREGGRSLANNPMRSREAQAYEYIYKSLLDQSKTVAPKMYKETVNIAKTFGDNAKNMDRGERIWSATKSGAAKIPGKLATGAALSGGAILMSKLLGFNPFQSTRGEE